MCTLDVEPGAPGATASLYVARPRFKAIDVAQGLGLANLEGWNGNLECKGTEKPWAA